MIQVGIAKAGMIAIAAHDRDPAARARLGCLGARARLVGLTAVFATLGLVSLPSKIVPMDNAVNEVILLIGLAVGVDYSLFYIRRDRDERRAGRSGRPRSRPLPPPPAGPC